MITNSTKSQNNCSKHSLLRWNLSIMGAHELEKKMAVIERGVTTFELKRCEYTELYSHLELELSGC